MSIHITQQLFALFGNEHGALKNGHNFLGIVTAFGNDSGFWGCSQCAKECEKGWSKGCEKNVERGERKALKEWAKNLERVGKGGVKREWLKRWWGSEYNNQ